MFSSVTEEIYAVFQSFHKIFVHFLSSDVMVQGLFQGSNGFILCTLQNHISYQYVKPSHIIIDV